MSKFFKKRIVKFRKNFDNKVKHSETKKILFRKTDICALCGEKITDLKTASIDHIVPKSLGGSESLKNLQVVHIKCNEKKGNNMEYNENNP